MQIINFQTCCIEKNPEAWAEVWFNLMVSQLENREVTLTPREL